MISKKKFGGIIGWLTEFDLNIDIFTQECYVQSWTSPGGNTAQGTNYTATSLPSRKLSKLDEPDMQDTAGEAGTSS